MTDQQRQVIWILWDERAYREALTAFFEEQEQGITQEIRSHVSANDIVGAAMAEGKLRILEQLPKNIELKGIARTGNS